MKRLVVFLIALFFVTTINAQFKGFWQPVKQNPYFAKELTADKAWNGVILVRMSAGVVATATTYNFSEKVWTQSAFNAVGFGLSANHYNNNNGEPYNDWSVNAFLFANETLSIAVTGSAWQYFQAGVIYTPKNKSVGFLTGLKYSF